MLFLPRHKTLFLCCGNQVEGEREGESEIGIDPVYRLNSVLRSRRSVHFLFQEYFASLTAQLN